MNVLLASTDLFFSSKVRETARQVGATVEQVRDDFAGAALRLKPDLVLVDLSATAFDPVAAVRALAGHARTIGFVQHEQAERIAAARAAGCEEVLARGAFAARLPELLSASPRGPRSTP